MVRTTLGHYEILELLGSGGMGDVYRAHDITLKRDVALKVLHEAVAADERRLARLEREAQLLAALNHPNVASIFSLEKERDTNFLVLELVEGETLARLLERSPLPVEKALEICRQIAEALESAHEKGIIHRDLKPGNVKVTPEGVVKVLDFGIAKALQFGEAASHLAEATEEKELTAAGTLLGTALYMSPEQIRGDPISKRFDIWSFGCILYETLTGQRAFGRETVADTLAAIIEQEPKWTALPAATPAVAQLLLRRCLAKDPKHRLQAIGDARIEIDEALGLLSEQSPGAPRSATQPRFWRQALPWALTVVATLAAGLALALLSSTRSSLLAPRPVMRSNIQLPPAAPLQLSDNSLALSPDGTRLVYIANVGGGGRLGRESTQLYLRTMDQLDARPIPGTEGATGPFFSPDGRWVGFQAGSELKRVALPDGAPVVICDALELHGASWKLAGSIIFGGEAGLMSVSPEGGEPEALTTLDAERQELAHDNPVLLPGGEAVLYNIWTGSHYDTNRIAVVSLVTGEQRILIEGGTHPRYTSAGQIVYSRDGDLMAVPFDLEALQVIGTPVAVLEDVLTAAPNGPPQYALSENGVLVYAPGGPGVHENTLLWVNRQGEPRPILEETGPYNLSWLSPDENRLAVWLFDRNRDIWIRDLNRGIWSRLTTYQGWDGWPLWTPDGERVTFNSSRTPPYSLYWKRTDGRGEAELLLATGNDLYPSSWSPDGRFLAYTEGHPVTGSDIWVLPVDDRTPEPFLVTEFAESWAKFSPDGRWIAYESDESGRYEVYVRPYPGPGRRWQVSTTGGTQPLWAKRGRELFYRRAGSVMAVEVTTDTDFVAGTPRLLIDAGDFHDRVFDVTADGQRLLMVKQQIQQAPKQLNVVLNWFEELKQVSTR